MTEHNKTSQEEYQYNENMTEAGYDEPEPVPDNRPHTLLSKLKSKRLLTLVGFILAVVIVYQFVMPHSQNDAALDDQSSMQQQAQPVASLTEVNATNIQSQLSLQNEEMTRKLENLNQRNQGDQERINQLQTELTKVQADVVGFEDAAKELNTSMQVLSAQVMAQNEKTKPKKALPPKPTYSVKAIVPGRAWLKSSMGNSITVKVGDKIEGYGVVQTINSPQGLVGMSNGTVFEYGENDS